MVFLQRFRAAGRSHRTRATLCWCFLGGLFVWKRLRTWLALQNDCHGGGRRARVVNFHSILPSNNNLWCWARVAPFRLRYSSDWGLTPQKSSLILYISPVEPIHYTIDCILSFLPHPVMGATRSPYIMKNIHYYHIHYEQVDCMLGSALLCRTSENHF